MSGGTTKADLGGILDELAELKRRISELESGNPLVGAIPRGAKIMVLDPNDGSLLATIGKSDATGALGAEFRNDAGQVVAIFGTAGNGFQGALIGQNPNGGSNNTHLMVGANGIQQPFLAHPWASRLAVVVNSTTFETTHSCWIGITQGGHFFFDQIFFYADAGTTGELRVQCATTGQFTSVVPVTGGTPVATPMRWNLSATVAAGVGPVVFHVQARVVSGAGAVRVETPSEMYGSSDSILTTINGF